MNNLCIIQARMSSTRLPGKCMKMIHNKPMTEWVFKAALKNISIDDVVIGTTNEAENKPLIDYFYRNIEVVDCSIDDLLTRYYKIAEKYRPDNIIRLTSDCPLLYFFSDVITLTIATHIHEKNDYTWNRGIDGTCSGLDVEVFTYEALQKAYDNDAKNREHVGPWMRENLKMGEVNLYQNFNEKWSVDTIEDFKRIEDVFTFLRCKK